jgi:hypothetical protein
MSHNVSDRASNDHVHWSRNAHRSSTPERNFGARWSARRRRASPAAAICTNATKAQSGGGQGVELTSAFGRAAEVHGSTASLPSTYVAMPEVSHALRHKTPQLQSAN